MTCSDNQSPDVAKLRQQAEQILREKTSQLPEDLKTQLSEKKQEVFHELQVHQIELEMQNEELRRAQVELETARTRYFDLYDLAPVGYVTVSEKGLILEANLTAATLLGVARSEMTKRPIAQFIFSKDQDAYYQYRKQLFETGTPQTSELRMVKRDGAIFWVWVSATVVQGADGLPVCRAVISDISERKRVEGELLETNHKLEQALAQAKAMADMAETANRTKSQFLANVSHEIRTPLSVMQGFSSILSDDMTLKPEQKQYVALIYKACNGLYQIVNDILDISKIESGKFKLQIAPFPMTKLLDDIESVMKPGANAKGLHFKVFRDEKHSAVVRADYNRVHQCLANLVGNAIKFTQKGHVHIRF